jgi:hypothetical protein
MDETNSLEDQENAQGEGKGGGYRNRMLWGCACSYLLPLILIIVYFIVRWYYHW